MSDIIWEVETSENNWVPLPLDSCRLIEEAKKVGRRAILVSDEAKQPVRAFLDNHEERIEEIGGHNKFRNIRRRSFPPIVYPSQVTSAPREVKKKAVNKSRKLTVTEAYSRARIAMMHAKEHNLSATNLVSEAKKVRDRKKRHDTGNAKRPGNTTRNIATSKTEFQIPEENDNYALSLLETDLPLKPSMGWVMKGAIASNVDKKVSLVSIIAPKFLHIHEPNIVAQKRMENTLLWALAKKRAKSKKAREGNKLTPSPPVLPPLSSV
jgi:hypothetical protein